MELGISINPVAFVIVSKESIKVLPIEHTSAIDKLMDYVPDLMQKANNIMDKKIELDQKIKAKTNEKTQKTKKIKNIPLTVNMESNDINEESENEDNINEYEQ